MLCSSPPLLSLQLHDPSTHLFGTQLTANLSLNDKRQVKLEVTPDPLPREVDAARTQTGGLIYSPPASVA